MSHHEYELIESLGLDPVEFEHAITEVEELGYFVLPDQSSSEDSE